MELSKLKNSKARNENGNEKWKRKHKAPDTYYYVKNTYAMLKRTDKTEQAENSKSSERQKI